MKGDVSQQVAAMANRLRARDLPLLQSGTFAETRTCIREAADLLEALAARLAEVEAERDGLTGILARSGDQVRNLHRAEAAESALARLRTDQDAMVGAVIEEAAALVRGYAQKMLAAVVYQYHSETLNRPMPIEFYEFIDVEHEDAKALGVQLSRDDKWAALSYTAQDEITDARIAVLTEALKPLQAAIRALRPDAAAALERVRQEARNAALGVADEMLEAMRLKLQMWEDDDDLRDWVAPGKTMIAEATSIRALTTPAQPQKGEAE